MQGRVLATVVAVSILVLALCLPLVGAPTAPPHSSASSRASKPVKRDDASERQMQLQKERLEQLRQAKAQGAGKQRAAEGRVVLGGGADAGAWSGWHTQGEVQSRIISLANEQLLEVTCVSKDGCSPSEEHTCSGVGTRNLTLTPASAHLLSAIGFSHGSSNSKACLSTKTFTPAHAGRGGDRNTLVGGCQASLPLEGRIGESVVASFVSLKQRTIYEVGLCFGDATVKGDSFFLRQVTVAPIQPTSDGKSSSGRAQQGLVPGGGDEWLPVRGAAKGCPAEIQLTRQSREVRSKYESVAASLKGVEGAPLQHYSFYGSTSQEDWDEIVRAHVAGIGYQSGQSVFEAGSAAGAFVESLSRQFGVSVSGADISPSLISIARSRVLPANPQSSLPTPSPSFCVANANNLSYIPSSSFDHSLAFGVLTYADSHTDACLVASELVRVTKPGGSIFIGQVNDARVRNAAPKEMEGGKGVVPDYWYKFASENGLRVRVLRGTQVYSQQVIPGLSHYDLHAAYRYNVYLQRPPLDLPFADAEAFDPTQWGEALENTDCTAYKADAITRRYTVDGRECALPFVYKGVLFEDCTGVGADGGVEWCSVSGEHKPGNEAKCAPMYRESKSLW